MESDAHADRRGAADGCVRCTAHHRSCTVLLCLVCAARALLLHCQGAERDDPPARANPLRGRSAFQRPTIAAKRRTASTQRCPLTCLRCCVLPIACRRCGGAAAHQAVHRGRGAGRTRRCHLLLHTSHSDVPQRRSPTLYLHFLLLLLLLQSCSCGAPPVEGAVAGGVVLRHCSSRVEGRRGGEGTSHGRSHGHSHRPAQLSRILCEQRQYIARCAIYRPYPTPAAASALPA